MVLYKDLILLDNPMTKPKEKVVRVSELPLHPVEADPKPNVEVKDCSFIGVKWDGNSLRTVQTVADGLLNLTELFNNQNIHIETMLRIEGPVNDDE